MGRIIIFMGATGAGKTIQAQRLAATGAYAHLSSGELLRQDPAEAKVLASGQLVASDQVERVMAAAIAQVPMDLPLILDGFPRTLDEAEWLEQQAGTWGREVRTVILFNVDQTTSQERLGRRQREDDTAEALAEKWREYESLTQPVAQYYEQRGILSMVEGNGSVDDVAAELSELLP